MSYIIKLFDDKANNKVSSFNLRILASFIITEFDNDVDISWQQ